MPPEDTPEDQMTEEEYYRGMSEAMPPDPPPPPPPVPFLDGKGVTRANCPLCGRDVEVREDRHLQRWRYAKHKPKSRPPGDEDNCDTSGELIP